MTRDEAQLIAEEEYTFSDYIQDRDGSMAGIYDHRELEDMADWREGLLDRVEEILEGRL
jgi:hypothetical protein